MGRYNKGATAERELIHFLFSKGFSIARVAGSGSSSLPCPDLLALKNGKTIAFESKAWKGNYLNISKEQMDEISNWADNAGAIFFIAWKVTRKGWFLLKKDDFRKNTANYSIDFKTTEDKAISLDDFVKLYGE